ncbi:LOW QUALITY PROTEIN: hypothetical protein PHMEG_00018326 [Phytophthora megakarya]|uniref:Eukaryotic/viral aspartic protease n=1 Tax=Phytophthora megakarya TaxID=4795 RepID=A0A225VWW0_9STRA|nr:LOW QUALITY PROTEIN: hypothetical protein PHMEG_00018326 [Phytophthora megakarya]
MVTPRVENRKAHVAREAEQTESTANTQPGTGRNYPRRQAPADDTSSDEGNPFYQDDDEHDATTEVVWQIRELTAMEKMYPTPSSRLLNTDHWITPFRGILGESENSMQWLRGFVYEVKGTHTLPNEWCMAFQLSLRDGASSISKDEAYLNVAEWQTHQLLVHAVQSISEYPVVSNEAVGERAHSRLAEPAEWLCTECQYQVRTQRS